MRLAINSLFAATQLAGWLYLILSKALKMQITDVTTGKANFGDVAINQIAFSFVFSITVNVQFLSWIWLHFVI